MDQRLNKAAVVARLASPKIIWRDLSLNRSASWAGYAGYNEKDRRAGEGGEIGAHGAKPKEAVRVARLAKTLQLAHMPIKKLTRQPEQPIGQTC